MRRSPGLVRRSTAVALGALLVVGTLAGAAQPASAAPLAVSGGSLVWGVKASFRSYLMSPATAGSITTAGGATQAASNGVFTFPVTGGTHDGPTSASASSVGSVHFTGHEGVLDVTISDVRITITGTTGTVVVDAVSRPFEAGSSTPAAPVTYDDVTFATLDLAGITATSTAQGYAAANIPTTITAAGVPVMGGFYPAGTALDPITANLASVPAPTCTPAKPTISAAGATTVSLAGIGGSCSGATGWRIAAYAGTSTTPVKTQDVASSATTATVTGLAARSTYRFRVAASNAGGTSAWSAYTTFAVPPFTSIESFVDQQFKDLKLRVPTASERSAWVAQLTNGTATPVSMVSSAIDFPEWGPKQSPVIRLFQAYFLRLPDIGGLNYWTGKSRNNVRIAQISSQFAVSSEFTRRYGALSNKAFVELVYQNVLGRPGDSGGIASWTSKLDRKVKNRGEVMVGFSESNEYKNKTARLTEVVNVYTGLLRRTPTTTESTNWQALLAGGSTRADIITQLLGSPAYDVRIG